MCVSVNNLIIVSWQPLFDKCSVSNYFTCTLFKSSLMQTITPRSRKANQNLLFVERLNQLFGTFKEFWIGKKVYILFFLMLYLAHKWIGPPSLLVEGWLPTGPTPSSSYLMVEMGLPFHIFPAYIWWELDQLFIKRHHQKVFLWT